MNQIGALMCAGLWEETLMYLNSTPLLRNAVTGACSTLMGLSFAFVTICSVAHADDGVRIPANLCAWEIMGWRDLNPAEKTAWSGLGWTVQTWDRSDPANYPSSYRKAWPELTYREKLLARKLGFSRKTWDAEGCPNYSTLVQKRDGIPDLGGPNGSTD
jgi:hypothetical protein